jgi:hypothetical protein
MEYRERRGFLTTAYQDIIGIPMSGTSILNINPNLSQKISVSYLRISVLLPSKPEWVFVADGSLDLNTQDRSMLDAWNALAGNTIKVKIGNFEDPLNYSVKNVVGGMSFDLVSKCSKGSILLSSTETLQLKLLDTLGNGDSIAYQCYGTVFVDDENY